MNRRGSESFYIGFETINTRERINLCEICGLLGCEPGCSVLLKRARVYRTLNACVLEETNRVRVRPRNRWEDNIKLGLQERSWREGMDWIGKTQDSDR
jgi:hypothetical protein